VPIDHTPVSHAAAPHEAEYQRRPIERKIGISGRDANVVSDVQDNVRFLCTTVQTVDRLDRSENWRWLSDFETPRLGGSALSTPPGNTGSP